MRAVSYPRVSTEEQALYGYSLDAQEEAIIDYINREKWQFAGSYIDPGHSGKDLKRPGIQQLLADMKAGQFEIIVVHKLDRISRNIGDLHFLLMEFEKYKIQFVSVTEKLDTSTAMGRMFIYILGIFAQWFRENLAEEVLKGQSQKHFVGERVSLGLINGYDVIDGKLIVNEDEADLVRRIFGLYVYKGYGYGRICQELNEQGIQSKTNSLWTPSTVKGMLSNVTYIGMNSWAPKNAPDDDRKIIKGEHEPILTEDVFTLAQNQLERRASLEISRSSYNYPFSSIVKCGECGGSYTSHNSIKKKTEKIAYTNYRCANRKSGKCKSSDIAELKLTRIFFDFLEGLQVELDEYTPEPIKGEIRDTEKVRRRIEKDLGKIEQRRTNLGMDLADRTITRNDYKSYMETINQQLTSLQNELSELKPEDKKQERSPDEIRQRIEQLKSKWHGMNNEDRKFILQMMVKRINIKKDDGVWHVQEVEFA